MDYPRYSYPLGLFANVASSVILLHRRSFRKDAKACIENLQPSLQVLGKENIPEQGPSVITVNHYHRPGFGAHWIPLAIAASVPGDMHWVMTGEFTYAGKWYKTFGSIGSRLLLRRLAGVYGFTTMPPMPPRPRDGEARAAAVRAVLDYVRQAKDPILGLAPEGYDPPQGKLVRPAPGLGRFGLVLLNAGLRFVPAGAYEANGCFYLHFGKSYDLRVERDLTPDEKDQQAAWIIMINIGRLLPEHLRGEFIEET